MKTKTPAAVEIPRSLDLAPPSHGELSGANQKIHTAYQADAGIAGADMAALLEDWRQLLADGWVRTVSDVVDAGESLNERRDKLNVRMRALKVRRFELAKQFLDDFKRVAAEAEAKHKATIDAAIVRFQKAGVTVNAFGGQYNAEAADLQLRNRAGMEIECLAAREALNVARAERDTIENIASAPDVANVVRDFIVWPTATGDAEIIAGLANVKPAPINRGYTEEVVKSPAVRATFGGAGKRPLSVSQHAALFD